jgi:hypothetical protein
LDGNLRVDRKPLVVFQDSQILFSKKRSRSGFEGKFGMEYLSGWMRFSPVMIMTLMTQPFPIFRETRS